jgi:hypothetical protein
MTSRTIAGYSVGVRLCPLVFATLLMLPSVASAEEGTVIPFQPPSSIGIQFNGRSPALFEGAILPHFLILKSRMRPGDPENAHRWALLFTPAIRVRMMHGRSDPVRSPSYMPRIDFQKLRVHDHGNTVDVWEWHAGIGHHSNGQSGCLFVDQTSTNGTCAPQVFPGDPENRIVSYRDGGFSTNDVRGGITFRHNLVNKEGQTMRDWSAGLEYQRQFSTDRDLKPVYTQNRLNGSIAVSWKDLLWTSRLRTEMAVGIAIDRPLKKVARWSLNPQVAWFPWSQSGLGLFVRLYHGQDYYNIRFTDNIHHRLQIGVQFEQDGFLKFKPR